MHSLQKALTLAALFFLIIGLVSLQGSSTVHSAQESLESVPNSGYPEGIHTQIITSIPDFYLTLDNDNASFEQQILPEFAPFLTITIVEVVIEQNFSKIVGTEFEVTLNGFSQIVSYKEGNMERVMQLLFVLDEDSQLGFTSPLILEWSVSTELDPDRFWPIGEASYHGIRVQYLKIITSPRPAVPVSEETPTIAYLIPNELYSIKEATPFGFIPTEVKAYVVLPENINDTYGLNLTVSTNTIVDYELVISNHFLLQGDPPKNTSTTSMKLNVRKNAPENQILSLITIRYAAYSLPPEGLILTLEGNWGFSTGPSSLIPTSLYDFPLFILATLIPIGLVSRLYKKGKVQQ